MESATASFTMATLLETITTIFTSMMSWVSTIFTTIAGNPILLLFVVGTFALTAIGIVRRLLKL